MKRLLLSPTAATSLLVLGLPVCAALALDQAGSTASAVKFRNARAQTIEFIGYSSSITLTPAQQELRNRALGAMPAPCCKKYSMATCCCPCNLAKSVWGLSNRMITKGADAATLQKTVREWLAFANPNGFTGDACDVAAGCQRAIAANGCGGMDEKHVIASR